MLPCTQTVSRGLLIEKLVTIRIKTVRGGMHIQKS